MVRQSTKALFAKHGWRVDRAVHNYIYLAFYYPYVKFVYLLFRSLARYFFWFKPLRHVIKTAFSRYHAKVMSFGDAKKVFELNEDIAAASEKNRKIIPFKYAHAILLHEPDFIAVMDCPCKKTLSAPEWSINSCLSVGKTTAQFWIDRCGKKYNAKKISQGEALDLIRKFREKGYLTQAFFKVATGGTMGIICNCHVDSCVSLQATQFARRFDGTLSMAAESGYSVTQDDERCKKCGTCARMCQFGAVAVNGEGWSYDRKTCMGCELCVEHCPEGAITLYRDSEKTVPLDLDIVRAEYEAR
jgi:Pyruvate/2-oxoacid:ferredoxin oxidoreductase delta subunit